MSFRREIGGLPGGSWGPGFGGVVAGPWGRKGAFSGPPKHPEEI